MNSANSSDWLGGNGLKHGNWYWYFPVGFSPEIVLVQGESAFFATGLTWRIKSMSGKWYGPITPPNSAGELRLPDSDARKQT